MKTSIYFNLLLVAVVSSASALYPADGQPVDSDKGWPWGIHMITIPLVLLFGIVIGWTLHERKVNHEDARRDIAAKRDSDNKQG